MSAGRVRRVADRIRVVVAEMLERRIKDARLGFVTITDVRVTGDTQHASIFFTVLGDEARRAESVAALESAKGLIRSEVAKQLGMRHAPTLEFILDALPESAAHIEDLLTKARQSDAAVAAAAAGASYAGDADPYKHDVDAAVGEDDEDDDDEGEDGEDGDDLADSDVVDVSTEARLREAQS
jgi:ribosome-binding factor A